MTSRIVECKPQPHKCELPPTDKCGPGSLAACDDCGQWWELGEDWGKPTWMMTNSTPFGRWLDTWTGPIACGLFLATLGLHYWLVY